MNISIVICVLNHLRAGEVEMKILQERLEETSDQREIARTCYLIEKYWMCKQELQKSLEHHLREINITEPINSFNPNIYTK